MNLQKLNSPNFCIVEKFYIIFTNLSYLYFNKLQITI